MTTGGAWSMKMREADRKKPHILPLNGGYCCFPTQEQISQKVPCGYGPTPQGAWKDMWDRYLQFAGAIIVMDDGLITPQRLGELKARGSNVFAGKWRWF